MNIREAKENYYANEISKEDSDNYVSELEKRNKEMLECLTKANISLKYLVDRKETEGNCFLFDSLNEIYIRNARIIEK